MSRGGWKSVAIVVRYEHASDQRDALLAQALKPSSLQAFKPSSLQAFKPSSLQDGQQHRASHARTLRRSTRGARDEGEVEGEVLDLPPLTSEIEEESSGGETRTLNLAGPPDEDSEQHQLE